MNTIRGLFHRIGNWHNKISVGAGLTKMKLRKKFKDRLAPLEIKELLNKLSRLERNALEASKTLNQLKNIIYNLIDPDTGKPKRRQIKWLKKR